ncbi:MAG TPA: DUF2341 domain-containing protein [Terriglobales bacterium]|nr:DUF2341 domain-containing protein [Terriglobales bacterium]
MLISLGSDSNLAGSAQTTGQTAGNDILFTGSDGQTKLNHEIEQFVSSSGQLAAWVLIPSLSNSADIVIYMYYGNSSAGEFDALIWVITNLTDHGFCGILGYGFGTHNPRRSNTLLR